MSKLSNDNTSLIIDSLRLIRTKKIGPVSYCLLKARYGSCAEAIKVLESCGQKVITEEEAILEFNNHKNHGSIILEKDMAEYPAKIKPYSKHFPIISIKGNPDIINLPSIAIVGARQCSLTAMEFTKFITKKIRNQYVTVSGLAMGVDKIAGENSMSTGHIGVLPGGIDIIYPSQSADLYYGIINEPNSCLVSCQPYGCEAQKNLFPIRNKLIAAIADGVIIIEAKIKSGSLQTADFALSTYKKPVFVVPGHPLDTNYEGNNLLLSKKGVIPIYGDTDFAASIEEFKKKHNVDQFFFEETETFTEINDIDLIQAYNNHHLRKSILSLVSLTPLALEQLTHYLNHRLDLIIGVCILMEIEGEIIIHHNMTVTKAIDPIILQSSED